jgi:hypothetical protein
MSYNYRANKGTYASQIYIESSGEQIFVLQLDYGGNDTFIDYYYNHKWYTVNQVSELPNDTKTLFILASNYAINNLRGYSVILDKNLDYLNSKVNRVKN